MSTPPKQKHLTIQNSPFQDAFPLEHGDFSSHFHVSFQACFYTIASRLILPRIQKSQRLKCMVCLPTCTIEISLH